MNIQSVNNTNYINKNTSFKSKIVPTEFLRKTIDYAIERPATHRKFYDSLIKILNDGKNDIVKFDYAKGWLLQKILPGAYNISVNGEKRPWNCFFGNMTIEGQCNYAVTDFAKDIDYKPAETKLDKIKKRHDQAWTQLVYLDSSQIGAKKHEKYMMKKMEYLKGLYYKTLSEEFEKVKKEIFKNK